jgi:hypothetical protein
MNVFQKHGDGKRTCKKPRGAATPPGHSPGVEERFEQAKNPAGTPQFLQIVGALALRLWPGRSDLFGRKCDHGRSESALLARYAAERIVNGGREL